MKKPIVYLTVLCACAFFVTSCSDSNRPSGGILGPTDGAEEQEVTEAEIVDAIQALRNYRLSYISERSNDMSGEAQAAKEYSDAVAQLTDYGARVEPYAFEALSSSEDWGIRYGALEVLDSIMISKSGMELLITAMGDANALVAMKALWSLRALSGRETYETGRNDLPADPAYAEGMSSTDYETLWRRYFLDNGPALQKAWRIWWTKNQESFNLD